MHQHETSRRLFGLLLACLFAASACGEEAAGPSATGADMQSVDQGGETLAQLCTWTDHPDNPLIEPPSGESLLGDPTVLLPEESPDDQWHLFANGLGGIHHFVSDDGVSWERLTPSLFGIGAFRPFVLRDGDTYYLFFEQFLRWEQSEIQLSTSADLMEWTTPVQLLEPSLDWETTGGETIGNPYVTPWGDGFRLYYSAGTATQDDVGFGEPLHIGVAYSDTVSGPYERQPDPIISPDDETPYRNRGAGSFKMLDDQVAGLWLAMNNGIYVDNDGRSRSAILLLSSVDGLDWDMACPEPIIAPGGDGWKEAFVYAFDTVRVGDEIWAYYNARDEWETGVERIGMATISSPR